MRSLDQYLAYIFGWSLPLAFLGYVAPFFFRRSLGGAITAGAIGAIIGPLLISLDSRVDEGAFIMCALLGASSGFLWNFVYRRLHVRSNGALNSSQRSPQMNRNAGGIADDFIRSVPTNSSVAHRDNPGPSAADIDADFETLVRHSSRIAATYAALERLPRGLKLEFRHALHKSKDPIQDAERIAKEIVGKHLRLLNPFDSAEANECLRQCREQHGEEAAKEFEAIYNRLGPSADPLEIFEKIAEARKSPPQSQLPHTPPQP